MRARLTTAPDGQIELESSYDAYFVAHLKAHVPYGSRSWDSARKRWLVSALYVAELLTILKDAGYQVQDERAAQTPHTPALGGAMPPELAQAFAVLHLATTAPLVVAEVVYKTLARYYHPDVGGNADDFCTINTAIDTIRGFLKGA